MKKTFFIPAILIAIIFMSCEALPFNYSKSESWSITEKNMITLSIAGVKVDRMGGWDSIEKEVTALAPLYFWNHGYRVVEQQAENQQAAQQPAYAAWIHLREREFNLGWNTKRSLAVEVRLWPYENVEKLPEAAGRVVATGNASFSSSQTTGRLLSKAIGIAAAKQLAAAKKGKKAAKTDKGENNDA